MKKYSFEKGYKMVPLGKADEVKAEIMKVFGITSKPAWFRRLRGQVQPRVGEAAQVEEVFKKYNISPKDIWGEE